MRIGHETIYHWIYLDARNDGTLYRHLRRQRKKRRKQRRYGAGRRFRDYRIGIDQRPAVVASRQRFGDWEGNSVQGKPGTGGFLSMVERKSRYPVAAKLESKKAEHLSKRRIKAFGPSPRRMRQTLTLDNGSEFASFKKLEKDAPDRLFCRSLCRLASGGANENSNDLLRQYFPKGYDLRNADDHDIAETVRRFNHRPRKCLSFRTSYDVFWSMARGALAI